MPWKPATLNALEREKHALQMKLLQANSALRLKVLYAERLEHLVCERNKRVDSLYGLLEQARRQNQRLEAEAEHLASLIANDHQAHIEGALEAP